MSFAARLLAGLAARLLAGLAALGTALTLYAPQPAQATPVDVYVTPGVHHVNGRQWRTDCEPYSVTQRCRTEIWATTVRATPRGFQASSGWAFNNLTYQASPRETWVGNNLGRTAEWEGTDGRRWRTECDTALTGANGCRSFIEADVIASTPTGYRWQRVWQLNNMVRFTTPPTMEKQFPDPGLRACVRKQFAAVKAIPSRDNVGRLGGWFSCDGGDIRDLTGIDWFTDVFQIRLVNQPNLRNLAPLKALATVPNLALENTGVSDLSALGSMKGLERLWLIDNPGISDLGPLARTSGITQAVLNGNAIVSLDPLASHTSMRLLIADDNLIRDARVIDRFPRLEGLELRHNQIADLAPVARHQGLSQLLLSGNRISDLGSLRAAHQFELIELDDNLITDVSPLRDLTSLTWLDLSGNQITDWSPLAELVRAGLYLKK